MYYPRERDLAAWETRKLAEVLDPAWESALEHRSRMKTLMKTRVKMRSLWGRGQLRGWVG
jgi:hypothetical protein